MDAFSSHASNFSGLLAFVRTADLGNFVSAGRVLGISASAVGKAVTRLEQELGVRLFHRSTRRIALTEEGRQFHERCRRALEDLDEARTLLSHAAGAPRGRLRISVPIVTYHLLLPLLPEFLAQYPELELDVDFNDRIVDLIDEGVDVAIRSGDLADSRLVSLPLRHYRFVLCASPAYLARRGTPDRLADLAAHDGILFRYPNSGQLQAWPVGNSPDGSSSELRLRRSLVFNNMEAVRGAALGGLGIGCLPDFLARRPLQADELRALLELDARPAGRFHAVWQSSRHLSPKVRAFVDFLKVRLADDVPLQLSSAR